jgi:hypothetical protein
MFHSFFDKDRSIVDTKVNTCAIIKLHKITFYGGVLSKLPKYILIAFISFNIIGGTFLGIFQYKEDRQTKKAFENFYKNNTQVMGAYDKKTPGDINMYVMGGVAALFVIVGSGVLYSMIKRESLKR